MNREIFDRIFSEESLLATAPFLVLSAGIMLLILVEIVPGLVRARNLVFLATLAGTAWAAVRTLDFTQRLVFEGTYAVSSTTSWWTLIFVASVTIAWIFGRRFYREDARVEGEHDILLLSAVAGMVLMAGARDLIVFFVGLELLSVPLYALSAFRRARRESIEAGLKYFMLGAFAAATFLMGAALVYAGTGTVTIGRMNPSDLENPLSIAGAALVAASLFFKVSVFPFHLWVPDVYEGAPAPVTTFMATGTKSAAFAFLLAATFVLPPGSSRIIAAIALLTMAAGNFGALVQTDLKRMLAYSGIAHAGTVLLAIAAWRADPQAGSVDQAVLFYMAAYVFTAGGAFGILTLLESQTGKPITLDSIRGLAQRRPGLAAAFALFMMSLGGIPATGGFLGKYLVFSVAVRADMITAAVIGILLSVVALGYYLRVVVALYMQPAVADDTVPTQGRALAGLAALVCATMVIVLGVIPAWFLVHIH